MMWVVIIFLCWQISFYTICNGGRLQYMNGCEYGCSALVALTVRRIELRYSEKNFSQCHCVIHKPYADGLESRRVSAVRTADVKHEVISFTFMWPCIVTDFFVIKPTRCSNFTLGTFAQKTNEIFCRTPVAVFPDVGPVRSETCRSLMFLKNAIANVMTVVCIFWLIWTKFKKIG